MTARKTAAPPPPPPERPMPPRPGSGGEYRFDEALWAFVPDDAPDAAPPPAPATAPAPSATLPPEA